MAITVNAVLDRAIDYAYATYPTVFAGFERSFMQEAFSAALTQVFPNEVALSTTSPDFESIILQLTTELSKNPVWYDSSTADTGRTLIRMVAAGIAYSQFSIERALQESFGHLASSPSSIYASAELLGVRVTRVVPAVVQVRLTRLDRATLFELPRFTVFSIGQQQFFNRDKITFPVDFYTVDVQLTQGTLYYNTFKGTGQPYQELEIGDGTKDLSDTDVYINVGGRDWERSNKNPWLFTEQEEKFGDNTTPNGDIQILFGNDIFGKAPPIASTIIVTWVRTLGEKAHFAQSGLPVTYNGPSINDQISGETLSNISLARDMIGPDFYARTASYARAAGENAVRRQDYRRWAIEYPGVKDALFRGQAELGPHKRSMMNVIGATVMSTTPLSNDDWIRFVTFMQEKGIFQCHFVRMDPAVVQADVEADIYCSPKASLAVIKDKLENNIRELFALRLGWLGFEIWKSDITDILEGVGELGGLVEYVDLLKPTTNLKLANKASYINLRSVKLNMFYSTRENASGRIDINQA